MNWHIFWTVLVTGVGLVVLQGITSWFDGYFSQAQMCSRGVVGWSLLGHGGMWCDIFIISPLVAYFLGKYRLDYLSGRSLGILGCSLVIAYFMGELFRRNGILIPSPHAHDGKTTLAGWIHGLFAVVVMWTIAIVYLGLTTPVVSVEIFYALLLVLIVFFFIGIRQFSRRWKWDPAAKVIVTAEILGLLFVTGLRILLR